MATRHSMLLIGVSILLYSRWWIMEFKTPTFQKVDNPASFVDTLFSRVMNYNYIYALNCWILLCPIWLCFDWSMGCVPLLSFDYHFIDPRVLAVLIFWIILITLIFRAFNSNLATSRLILMSLAFMIVPFSVASNLFFRVGFVIAERVLYIPSAGFCMLVSLGIHHISNYFKMRLLLYVSIFFLLTANISRCYQRSLDWKNERTLFQSGLDVCPLNAKVHYNLAKTSLNHTEAIAHYREAIRLHPEYEQAMNNLANILRDEGNISEAESLLRKAVAIRPEFAAAWMNLGIVLSNMKRSDEALECYKTALIHRKNYPDCYYNLGNLFLAKNKYAEAYAAWRQATTQKPTHSIAWNNMIVMLDSIGKLEEAKSMGLEALNGLPKDSALHFNLANTLGKQGHYEEAEEHFKQAIKIRPGQALYHTNLGVLYHRWKRYTLAEEQYIMALKINQNLTNVVQNLKNVQKLISKMNLTLQ
ncbi:hypothetical protein AAG570_000741 [Ranatra chinensis]|uniref:dolichyl-phosphate-mannose--protein mannosyltransferase n=1 Tax=Ranatra chinensis TaxID=642074 RepID=A0ABD0ZJ50_9HEMI